MVNLLLLNGILTLLLLIFAYLMLVELQYHQVLRTYPTTQVKRQYKTKKDMEYVLPLLFLGCFPFLNLLVFIFILVCYVDSLKRLNALKQAN